LPDWNDAQSNTWDRQLDILETKPEDVFYKESDWGNASHWG